MPEGDTIHRSAARLATALVGRAVVSFTGPRLGGEQPRPGTTVERVDARGKFLFVHFDDGTVLETHMRMTGSWYLYRRGERWRRSRRTARAIIETDEWVAVCFAAPHVELRSARAVAAGRASLDPRRAGPEHLGPDLCTLDPDIDEVLERIERHTVPATPLVDALLDQRLFCGVGNVFKSEVLFACRFHPDTPIGDVDADARRRLAEVANAQLLANLGPGREDAGEAPPLPGGGVGLGPGRRTVPEGLAVYGRAGDPCRVCRTAIVSRRHGGRGGRSSRITYWCPACQPPPGRTSPDS